ncbi:MAG: tetratricopeptide repeat protein [Proteobacteria bacterium]|nr:tetratricopeptide repeat protein [Pseudomonadota bacterium]MDA1149530.1 tetratricopeptide repeat protein [Pseudomonadota bacterium]
MTSPQSIGLKIIMFLATAMLLLAYAPANADQTDPELDKLFAALQTSLSNASAASLERDIWTIWTRYPDDQAINRQMDRAIKMMNAGRLDDAEAMFSAIISRKPAFAEAWNKRATVRFFRGDDAGSANDILQVIKLEPRHFGALSGLSMIKVRKGDLQGALQAYRAAQRINPFLPNIEVIIDKLGQKLNGRGI